MSMHMCVCANASSHCTWHVYVALDSSLPSSIQAPTVCDLLPSEDDSYQHFAHFASFVRGAPVDQARKFLAEVGKQLEARLKTGRIVLPGSFAFQAFAGSGFERMAFLNPSA